jgi:hypothetical protein
MATRSQAARWYEVTVSATTGAAATTGAGATGTTTGTTATTGAEATTGAGIGVDTTGATSLVPTWWPVSRSMPNARVARVFVEDVDLDVTTVVSWSW